MRAMRSNIARTCGSSSVPVAGSDSLVPPCAVMRAFPTALLELAEERDERSELRGLRLGEALERRHRRGRVAQRLRDRGCGQRPADLRQVRPGPVVAVLADLVAGEAARLRNDELSLGPFAQRRALQPGGR